MPTHGGGAVGSGSGRRCNEVDVLKTNLSGELAAALAANESGLRIIYRALDSLVAQHDLEDAAIVIDEPNIGRQVFRAGRRVLGTDDELLLEAPGGLYTEPALPDDGLAEGDVISSLCVLALRMDLLRYDAWHDPLTGLYDRRSFDRLFEMAVARSTRYGWQFTLVLLDLDHLKVINDTDGHAAGDLAIRDLSDRMRRNLRFGDNAARIGGDEFAMILPDTLPEAVPGLLQRLRDTPGLRDSPPEFCYGVASCPDEATDCDSLLDVADSRLLTCKQARKVQR